MAELSENQMNLAALQRVDSTITGILDTASQVALYKFNSDTKEWESSEIKGTLFVFTRSETPSNGFIIMNHLSITNMIEPITSQLEFQLQDPFLLYRNANYEIYGIWFYDKDECARIGQSMNSLSQWASTEQPQSKMPNNHRQRRASESDSLSDAKTPLGENSDIISLLTKALHEYKIGSSPSRKPQKCTTLNGSENHVVRPTPLRASPNQENPKAPTVLSVEALFASAEKSKEELKSPLTLPVDTNKVQEPQVLLRKLKSNPENTLEHIERQMSSTNNEFNIQAYSAKSLEKVLKEKLHLNSDFNQRESVTANPPIEQTLSHSKLSSISPVAKANKIELNGNLLKAGRADQLTSPSDIMESKKISLLSPMALQSTSSKPMLDSNFGTQSPKLVSNLPTTSTNSKSEFVGPNSVKNPEKKPSFSKPLPKLNPLTKMQLTQALQYLLENDDEFMTKLHEGYIKSLESTLLRKIS